MPCYRLLSRALFSLIAAIISVAPIALMLSSIVGNAQLANPGSSGSIVGTVVDPQGAVVPGANLAITNAAGKSVVVVCDALGKYSVEGLTPGSYTIEVQASGFRTTRKDDVLINSGAPQHLNLTLEIAVDQQEVVVSAADTTLDSSPEKNGGAIVLKGSDLQALSDDQDEMQQQLQAMAGSDPETGTQFYVDGFSGGKLPPKSSIREIRINQNPYSAQYDTLGYGRIEIFTKPGTDKLHGDVWMQGNDSPLNARSPFVTTQPSYYSYQFEGDVNGPINKTASYFASTYYQNAVNDSIVNAFVLDPSLNQTSFTQAISSPTTNLSSTFRVDKQIGKVQTLSVRYQLERTKQTNGGVGQFNLASQAFNSLNTEQVLQISDTQAYGAKVVNETRFQYIRDRNNQTALTGGPTIAVQGAFTGGGSSQGSTRDNQDHYEFQDYVQVTAGTHEFNFGGRLRGVRDANYSTTNFNGQYTFASLAAYQITEQGLKNGLSPAAIRAAGGGASQFSQTSGTPSVAVSLVDTGLYAEDNWKVKPDITLSLGLRFETQTKIHDHADFGPRVAASWAIPGGKNKPPKAVLRTGGGFFYQRFQSTNLLQAQRQNGVTETESVVNLPDFYPATCTTNAAQCASSNVSSPTVYQVSPVIRSPYIFMAGAGIDKPISKYGSLSANYIFSRGEHLFLTRNINAPLPGTYDPSDPSSGTRPTDSNENIYEYDSEGASGRNRLIVNGNVRIKPLSLFGYYMLSKVNTNTAGIGTFPSNQYDLHVDYGRASYDVRNRLFLGGFTKLPWGFGLNPFIIYQSSAPFNIVVGEDLNGDTQFNDRPAFATDLTRSSVYHTKWGVFDAQPIAGQKIIPINYGKGPGLFITNLRLTKNFSFGPAIPDENPPPAPTPAKDDKATTKTPAKPVKKVIERKYNLGFSLSSDNVFNHVNLAPPIGVLGSPLFGTSTSLTTVFGSGSANRTVNLDMFFRF
ncbi:TonB-dependent receptor [Acidicapsa ligni]|uniref:TonB-dependent receptor n=1 Tax=Acidicapsa ligni TaxID=542300 RepID=UPI0021E046E7|nr:carboxypeptidase regulatory-like domain-containing protein [Acidicapsa ligni]